MTDLKRNFFFVLLFFVFVFLKKMATNFLELATTLNYLGAKWLLEKISYFHALGRHMIIFVHVKGSTLCLNTTVVKPLFYLLNKKG